MACSKYTLTNTGTTVINFNYRRCDDSMWQYQIELYPNETKNIWLMDNTFSIAPLYDTNLVLVNNGVFPPVYVTPTPTPTPSVTPSNTPTQTTTPSVTPTNTETPTNTPTNSGTPTETPTNTPTPNPTSTPTETIVLTPTATVTETSTPTNTPTNTQTGTPDVTPTPSTTIGATPTQTETQTPTPTTTLTETPTNTPTNTQTGTPDVTSTPTNTQTGTPDVTSTPTNTETPTPTPTVTGTASVTPSNTPTLTPTPSTTPPSGVIVTIQEVGSNVVMTGSGSINLNDLDFVRVEGEISAISGQAKFLIVGPDSTCNRYSGATYSNPSDFSSTSSGFIRTNGSGNAFGAAGLDNQIIVPDGYVSGTYLSGTSTFAGQSINSMSLIPGTYVWSWGTGINADTITLTILPPPTPTNTPTTTETPTNTPTITQTQTSTQTPTPTYTPTPTVTPTPAFSVLYLGGVDASTEASDIQTYLTNTGYSMTYSAVTLDLSYDGSGGITLPNYDVVVLYTPLGTSGGTYSATLGTAISDYVASGGNLITGANIWRTYPSGFNHSGLTAFNANANSGSNPLAAGFGVYSNFNPILSGVSQTFSTLTYLNGRASSPSSQLVPSTGSRVYSIWIGVGGTQINQLAYKKVGNSNLVSFNGWFPGLGDFGPTGNGSKIYGNSILMSLGLLPQPSSYISITNEYNNSGTGTITGVTISGLTGSQPVGLPVTGNTFPLLNEEINTGFTTTEWGSYCNITIGVDLPTPLTGGTLEAFIIDSFNTFTATQITSGGTYTFNGYVGNNISFPTPRFQVGIQYTP
jgi:hypothetical protein